MATSPLSYLILVVDIRPSLQQHLHNGEMSIIRGPDKGRVPILHHIDREGEMVLPPPLLIHTQAIAQGHTGHTEGGCPGHGDGEEQVRLRPMVTWVISESENGKNENYEKTKIAYHSSSVV